MMSERSHVLTYFEKYKDYTDERIKDGIENYRKGHARITVKDRDGNPIRNAKIIIKQKSHDFKYGANLFMLEELETAEKNELYKRYFSDVFNMATVPFYWKDLEPVQGKPRFSKDSERIYRRPPIDLCIDFCEEHNIEPRAHCLNYDLWNPEWILGASTEHFKEQLEKRMQILSQKYADRIPCWEVTNETIFPRVGDEKASSFYRDDENVEWSFRTAEKYFPRNELSINDAHCNIWENAFNYNRSAYYMQIERALQKGARIDSIGMQFHMFYKKENELEATRYFYDPKHLYTVMDFYSRFQKPLQITEVTIPAYSNSEEDERIQAEIIEKLYSIWFSHPNMEQIIYWNLVDGYAAFAPLGDMTSGENYFYGGLLRFDMTPKPAYYTIKNLFEKVWHTEAEIMSDDGGYAEFKGFYGTYDVIVNGQNYTVHLSKDSDNDILLEFPLKM